MGHALVEPDGSRLLASPDVDEGSDGVGVLLDRPDGPLTPDALERVAVQVGVEALVGERLRQGLLARAAPAASSCAWPAACLSVTA